MVLLFIQGLLEASKQEEVDMRRPLLIIWAILILAGCSRSGLTKDREVVAYVNREPILASELKKEVALKAKRDPMFKVTPEAEYDYLDMIIDRKLIVQAAIKKGLAREDRFINTIKTFWEQTLIRDYFDYKKNQFQDYLFVTDDDVKKYYGNLSQKVTFRILRMEDKRAIDEAYKKYIKDKDISTWQVVGPLGYEDITSNVLLDAFEAGKGEVRKIDDGHYHYLIEVAEKEKITLEPLENIRSEIEKRVIAMKERRLFEDWLRKERKEARIKITK